MKGKEWWVPRYRGWRSGSLYRGDGEGFLVHGEKREAYWGSAGDDFIPYMTIFLYWGWDREAAEVALNTDHVLSPGPSLTIGRPCTMKKFRPCQNNGQNICA
jgi:hypothetical protein